MDIEKLKEIHKEFGNLGNNHEDRRLGVCFHGAASALGIIIKAMEGTEKNPELALAEFYGTSANNILMMAQLEAMKGVID